MSTVLVFAGLPGSGKSTLAERIAGTIKAPVFAGDWLMGVLKPYGMLKGLDRASYLAMYYELLRTLVVRQLMLGQSAIVDCLMDDERIAAWRETAAGYGAELVVVECVCSDADLHRSRIEGRTRGIPGWPEVGWEHVSRMRSEFPALTAERITVDAVHPVEHNEGVVLAEWSRKVSG
jgi:predicted kinase